MVTAPLINNKCAVKVMNMVTAMLYVVYVQLNLMKTVTIRGWNI